MFAKSMLLQCRCGLFVAAVLSWPIILQGQSPAAPGGENYVLKTYEVGDLIINIQDHPYSESIGRAQPGGRGYGGGGFGGGGGGFFSMPDEGERVGGFGGRPGMRRLIAAPNPQFETREFQLVQYGGGVPGERGMGGGGMGGGFAGGGEGIASPVASIGMADILRVLTGTIDPASWEVNGGEGQVEPLGTSLVIWQTPKVHDRISGLLANLRDGSAERKTVTVDARWLMLDSDELDALLLPDQTGVPEVNRKRLAEFTRRPSSIRGITNCYSSQLVYLVSGTRKNVVSGFIPVVGSVESTDRDVELASGQSASFIRLVADTPSSGDAQQPRVGYQPIVEMPNFGALLEIRPTLVPSKESGGSAIVDLKSTVTVPGDPQLDQRRNAGSNEIAPVVDRIAIETQEFATTLRMPLGKPVLVGGLTYVPSSNGSEGGTRAAVGPADDPAAEKRQLYLVLEVR
ncbi:MAG: hypothetical protein L0228_14195 [Planctomycetes bacterium]|nr:hypothetical protein [Planctomycetota bacterium]